MNPPKPFPILRLLFLAIEEVIKALDPIEIINFSIISKRTKGIAKQMSFFPKYSMGLFINETLDIMFCGTGDMVSWFYAMTSDIKMDGKIEEDESDGCIIRRVFKYSKDPVEEWKQLFKHVSEIFKKQTIDVLRITMDSFLGQNVSIIEYLKVNMKSVDLCYLFQTNYINNVDKHTAYLLDNIKIISELTHYLYTENYDFDGKIPKYLQHLCIYNSQWIGFERLLEIDSESVVLKRNLISDEQWNVFFKKWIAMDTHLNLQYLELDYRNIEQFRALVLNDIPHEVVDLGVKRVLKIIHDETKEISGGIDIRRIDGKTATFFVHYTGFSMSVH
ncbi:hypothetical protein GCK72_015423 [Caenorhabditis remanei]|uniref:F-box domain-containing protein n=1 Tax=Caenorhabditis remanei TaxID=31234 RepID=A0A6A5GX23_CAERE|nr:hypothetical protein GCK72_015423 [Caenorhabditis remanei]KAF1758963.1 hypothetical protein GCK72_015423 [Caenorhabditis remanei]